jgi:predicted ATPase
MGTEGYLPYFLASLAETCGAVGAVEEGLTLIAEALDIVTRTGERFYEAELYRLKGELMLQESPAAAAEPCFQQALEVARQQEAKSWELRAATSLVAATRQTSRSP